MKTLWTIEGDLVKQWYVRLEFENGFALQDDGDSYLEGLQEGGMPQEFSQAYSKDEVFETEVAAFTELAARKTQRASILLEQASQICKHLYAEDDGILQHPLRISRLKPCE